MNKSINLCALNLTTLPSRRSYCYIGSVQENVFTLVPYATELTAKILKTNAFST